MRSTDLCKNSGFCSDTARYSFSEIVPFLQKCTHTHMYARARAPGQATVLVGVKQPNEVRHDKIRHVTSVRLQRGMLHPSFVRRQGTATPKHSLPFGHAAAGGVSSRPA